MAVSSLSDAEPVRAAASASRAGMPPSLLFSAPCSPAAPSESICSNRFCSQGRFSCAGSWTRSRAMRAKARRVGKPLSRACRPGATLGWSNRYTETHFYRSLLERMFPGSALPRIVVGGGDPRGGQAGRFSRHTGGLRAHGEDAREQGTRSGEPRPVQNDLRGGLPALLGGEPRALCQASSDRRKWAGLSPTGSLGRWDREQSAGIPPSDKWVGTEARSYRIVTKQIPHAGRFRLEGLRKAREFPCNLRLLQSGMHLANP